MYHLIAYITAMFLTTSAHFTYISDMSWKTENECKLVMEGTAVKHDLDTIMNHLTLQGYTDVTLEKQECLGDGEDI